MVPDHLDLRVIRSGTSESLEEYVKSGCVLQDSGSPDGPARSELRQVTTIPLSSEIDDYVGRYHARSSAVLDRYRRYDTCVH
jgi:hypothetical protein